MHKIHTFDSRPHEEEIRISHFPLQGLLPSGQLLALSMETRTLSLMAEGPLLLMQQQFSDNEIHIISAILDSFPHYCPYEVLLSSISSTYVTSASVARWRQRLQEAQTQKTWQQELRPIYRALSSLRNKLCLFQLEISTVRDKGCSLTAISTPPPGKQ